MKLLVKFNLLLIVVFGLGLFVIAYQARSFLQQQAQAEVLRQAGLMAASASATRNYTEPLPLIRSGRLIRITPIRKRR